MEEGQRQFRDLLMGPGTDYPILKEEGLDTLTIRSGTRPAPRTAGSIPGLHLADSKRIVLALALAPGSTSELESIDAALRAVMVPSESEEFQYIFRLRGQTEEKFVWARVIDRPSARDLEWENIGLAYGRTVGFEVADPRIYSVEEHSELVPIFSVGFPGLNLPIVNLPANMNPGIPEDATLVNAGDQPAYPICRFQFEAGGSGDFDGVTLTNETNGSVLTINTTVNAGQILIADMDAYVRAVAGNLIVYIDTSSRFGDWAHPREPFYLSPGDNVVTFEILGSSPTTDAACLISWRDTSI